ncbi:MAG: copper homeostasis protein CutC [Gammaproteobacteria bacterium]|nr:MAG: copper homeostasis protein CutC [Gammaproteobacteria bacterium]
MNAVELEIAANSLASALAAQEGGADRIELCAALEVGGLTPSHATIALVRERVKIPIYVLIRARAGDFVYDDAECETMQRDIEHCVAEGCDGVVLGALDADGNVDLPRCRALIGAAGKLGVTFHRAFDLTRDPRQALEDAIALGCERVLTSGGQASALAGAALIRDLVAQAAGRIAIMAGAGVDATNIAALRTQTGAREFHASAKRMRAARAHHATAASPGMDAGELRSDVAEVRRLVTALRDSAI